LRAPGWPTRLLTSLGPGCRSGPSSGPNPTVVRPSTAWWRAPRPAGAQRGLRAIASGRRRGRPRATPFGLRARPPRCRLARAPFMWPTAARPRCIAAGLGRRQSRRRRASKSTRLRCGSTGVPPPTPHTRTEESVGYKQGPRRKAAQHPCLTDCRPSTRLRAGRRAVRGRGHGHAHPPSQRAASRRPFPCFPGRHQVPDRKSRTKGADVAAERGRLGREVAQHLLRLAPAARRRQGERAAAPAPAACAHARVRLPTRMRRGSAPGEEPRAPRPGACCSEARHAPAARVVGRPAA
jgi:hypothetical protein